MNIIELKTGIIEGMAKLVIDDLKDNEYEGTPFESMAVIESLNFSAEFYKNWFLEKKMILTFLKKKLMI